MRTVILSQISDTLVKIVWIEECQGGIYMGFYGGAKKMHLSYHQDGNVHLKDGRNYLPMYKTSPINTIDKFVSLNSFGITLDEGYRFATSIYTKIKKANAIIFINPSIIKRKRILNIHAYLVRNGEEANCLTNVHSQQTVDFSDGQGFELISANFFKLDKFKNHLVGIFLIGGS